MNHDDLDYDYNYTDYNLPTLLTPHDLANLTNITIDTDEEGDGCPVHDKAFHCTLSYWIRAVMQFVPQKYSSKCNPIQQYPNLDTN